MLIFKSLRFVAQYLPTFIFNAVKCKNIYENHD